MQYFSRLYAHARTHTRTYTRTHTRKHTRKLTHTRMNDNLSLRSLRSRFAYGLLMPAWRADGGR